MKAEFKTASSYQGGVLSLPVRRPHAGPPYWAWTTSRSPSRNSKATG